ncbi:chloramphenicol acetyltransferase CAT [Lactobacillus sp. PFC-70]|nr:chloramphenicol acetyltransferase CAT [Lactobacillus sp. PFC-70]
MSTLNTHFTPIDQSSWERRDYFYYFTQMAPTGFSLTANLDVTATRAWTKTHHRKFNATYLYLVSRILTQHPEMRIGRVDDQLVTFDVIHPSYTIIHADHTMANLWTAYDDNFDTFYHRYLADLANYGQVPGPMPKTPLATNLYPIGSLPWLHFTNYTPLPFTPLKTFFPIFQAGQFTFDDQGQCQLPLSVTIHHAVADGYHVSMLFHDLQAAFNRPDQLLSA